MLADIRPYRDEYWPDLHDLLADQWRADLPLLHKPLFDWQYRGFGPLADSAASRVLFVRDRLAGFYGAIPGVYRLPDRRTLPGLAMALWLVHREYRNSGLGILLLRELEQATPVTLTLGANADTVRYLTAAGYTHLPALSRFVAPLEADGYLSLCGQPVAHSLIVDWMQSAPRAEGAAIATSLSATDLAARWQACIESPTCEPDSTGPLTLERTAGFYQWRYLDSAGFRYVTLAGPGQSFAIVRLEEAAEPSVTSLSTGSARLRVLRIIELWLDDTASAAGSGATLTAEKGIRFVAGLLAWGRDSGACAADFQCSSRRFAPVLIAAGMRGQSADYGPAICSLAGLFDPLRPVAPPINALWRVAGEVAPPPCADHTLFLKSDGDMDRPNSFAAIAAS